MKRVLLVLLAASGLIASGAATAAKVNMPKEGSYEFEFCSIGRGAPETIEQQERGGGIGASPAQASACGNPFDQPQPGAWRSRRWDAPAQLLRRT